MHYKTSTTTLTRQLQYAGTKRGKLKRTPTHRFLDSEEAVTHPAASRAVAADVGEALLVVAIGSTEGDLLDRLVDDQALLQTSTCYKCASEVRWQLGLSAQLTFVISSTTRKASPLT